MRLSTRLSALVALSVAAAVAWPSAAAANTYCVPNATACPGGGTAVATVQQALNLAAGNPGLDRVQIGENPCPACKFAGGEYQSSAPLEVVGAGRANTTLA